MSLDPYREKRDFGATPEPSGEQQPEAAGCRFVVQEHHARRLHWDFRLEMEGVLKSWAVPKGPSLNPHDKRLAVQTEDHPLDYIDFEGEIPVGSYGAGQVAVWDSGEYEPLEPPDPAEGVRNGKLTFILRGRKLCGEFHLVRTKQTEDSWLMFKHDDECARQEWTIEQSLPNAQRGREVAERSTVVVNGESKRVVQVEIGREAPMPDNIDPMLATAVDQPFDDPEWLFEVKWDGYRSICYVNGDSIRFVSRGRIDLGKTFPGLLKTRGEIAAETAVIDGEIVALTPEGKPDFQTLQNASGFGRTGVRSAEKPTLVYYAFDLIYCNGRDLTQEPLVDRKRLLEQVVSGGNLVRYSDHIAGKGTLLFEHVQSEGMEGIVAKQSRSVYEQRRTRRWLKVKAAKTMDVVVGGYTEPRGSRRFFGALIVGLYRDDGLHYVAHTGGGFTDQKIKDVYDLLQPLRTDASPFTDKVETNERAEWVRPELVCEVKYTEMTSDGKLRQPIFLRMRNDKSPSECTFDSQVAKPAATRPHDGSGVFKPPAAVPAEELFARSKLEGSVIALIEGLEVPLTNLEKIYWPDSGLSKGEFVRYHYQIAPYMLPHLKDRPLVLKRYPNGINQDFFYQHNVEDAPPWVQTWLSPEEEGGERVTYSICNNAATLIYLANLGAVEISPWHSRYTSPDNPDWVVFDLDPEADVEFGTVCEIGLAVRDVLEKLGLRSYAKTSGGAGMHIYVPLDPVYSHEQVTGFAEVVVTLVQGARRRDTTLERMTRNRPAKTVYLDYLQNGPTKTLVSVYAARARPGAQVSAPLTWDEVKQCRKPGEFNIVNEPERVRELGDLFAPVVKGGQELAKALDAIGQL